MHKLFQTVYLSAAANPLSEAELRQMHQEAVERNTQSRITGILLYKDDRFMQSLEGPESAVKAAFGRISKDPRHYGIVVLIKETVKERHFPAWPMAFRNLDLPEQRDVPGYDEFSNAPLTGKEFASTPSRCEKLLLLFKPEPTAK